MLFELCVAHQKQTKNLHLKLQQTATTETTGLIGNPVLVKGQLLGGDQFMSPKTKLKWKHQKHKSLI